MLGPFSRIKGSPEFLANKGIEPTRRSVRLMSGVKQMIERLTNEAPVDEKATKWKWRRRERHSMNATNALRAVKLIHTMAALAEFQVLTLSVSSSALLVRCINRKKGFKVVYITLGGISSGGIERARETVF